MSRKRSIRFKRNPGMILRQPCKYFLKGTCTRSSCEYWHPPKCQFNKTEPGCKAGDKCFFPHHMVDEQPNKKANKGHDSRESDDKNAVAIVEIVPNWVASRKTRMHWFLKEANSPGVTRCEKS